VAWAAGIGGASVYVGLLLSYHYDLSAGATVVFTAVCAFFIVLTFTLVRANRTRPSTAAIA
jgi:manganese/iron transport system permease protein